MNLQPKRRSISGKVVGRLDDLPPDAFRRVMETNFFGRLCGARTALRRFRVQDHGISIDVNIAST